MNEKDAWDSFFQSGSVPDYLRYKMIQHMNEGDPNPKDKAADDEVQDQGTDTPPTEYR